MVNASPEPSLARVAVDGRAARGRVVDLRGSVVEPLRADVPLRPWQIVTLELDA
jgi:hypothetical protein